MHVKDGTLPQAYFCNDPSLSSETPAFGFIPEFFKAQCGSRVSEMQFLNKDVNPG